jgi:PAS domain S-box-containing protein
MASTSAGGPPLTVASPGQDTDTADVSHRFRTLLEHARDMVYRARFVPTRTIEYVGGAVEAITGHTAAEFYADPDLPQRIVHPDDIALLTGSLESGTLVPPTVTVRWIHPDGRLVVAEHRRMAVYDADGRIVAVEGIARDITVLVENQRRLRESEEQLRQLAARLQGGREDERAQVARELHDELGQTLTALKLEIGRMIAALTDERLTPTVVDRLQSLMGLSDIGLATVKRIATNLRPPTLDHLGLAEAIHWEALTFKARTGIRCHVRVHRQHSALTAAQQTALFRIFQEALTNIVRHAQASAVTVSLVERGRRFELRISDNGRGITELQAADPRALGLLGMRERAALVGGDFRITGRAGKGTLATVTVPVPGPKPRAAGSPPARSRPKAARAAR